MKLGKSIKDEAQERYRKLMTIKHGIKKFAWLPVRDNWGQWIWIEFYILDWCICDHGNGRAEKVYESPIAYSLNDWAKKSKSKDGEPKKSALVCLHERIVKKFGGDNNDG